MAASAAIFGLRCAVGVQEALLGDLGQPFAFLFERSSEEDRVAAKERRKHAGGHADIETGHLLAHAVDVDRAAAHPAVLLGDEQQLDAKLVTAHPADEVLGAHVVVVQLQLPVLGERIRDIVADRLQRHLQRVCVETGLRTGRRWACGECHRGTTPLFLAPVSA
jgi:hypothetical protein